MKIIYYIIIMISITSCNYGNGNNLPKKINPDLTPEEEYVIINKGTEKPFSGEYWNNKGIGTYKCKNCGADLYRSSDKFESHCGWPSFDDEIPNAVKRIPDADGHRTEIICSNCGGHLGHVFIGERLTDKNVRHCVNSLSIEFVPQKLDESKYQKAIFAAGCFWGVEYLFKQLNGVVSTQVGYTGGKKDNPTYQEVCTGTTGHKEAVEIIFDTQKLSYEELARFFFEIHDPTQSNGQGPDIGEQYLSIIYYFNDEQKQTAEKLISILRDKGLKIATTVVKAVKFYAAEEYHQDYYNKKGTKPYCHIRKKIF